MKLYGVFIGINRYKDKRISNLNYARKDAEDFHELILNSIQNDDLELQLLIDEAATKDAVQKAIGNNVSNSAKEEDMVLIYFSGHGSSETSNTIDKISKYLILHDTTYDEIYPKGLNMDEELRTMCFDRIKSKSIIVIIDSCFSGRAGGRTFASKFHRNQRLDKQIKMVSLEELELGEGRLIMTASDDDEVARESQDLQQGVFTHFLFEVLTKPNEERNEISVGKLYDQVCDKVQIYTNSKQNPILNGRSRNKKLPYLNKNNKTIHDEEFNVHD